MALARICRDRKWVEALRLLRSVRPPNVNEPGGNGMTPLIWASCNGGLETMKGLLARGASVTSSSADGFTALHWASGDGNPDIVGLLVAHGAEVNAADKKGWTPLHWACHGEQADAIATLIAGGADLSATTQKSTNAIPAGSTVLDIARIKGWTEHLNEAIERGLQHRKDLARQASGPLQENMPTMFAILQQQALPQTAAGGGDGNHNRSHHAHTNSKSRKQPLHFHLSSATTSRPMKPLIPKPDFSRMQFNTNQQVDSQIQSHIVHLQHHIVHLQDQALHQQEYMSQQQAELEQLHQLLGIAELVSPATVARAQARASRRQLEPHRASFEGALSDDYEFKERLGRSCSANSSCPFYGSNAAVFSARRKGAEIPIDVCVKIVYNAEALGSRDVRHLYEAEFELLQQIPSHPNIVMPFASFTDRVDTSRLPDWHAPEHDVVLDFALVLVKELLPMSLIEMMHERVSTRFRVPYFSRAEIIAIASGLADALVHLQQHRVVHRDVKADNVLLEVDSNRAPKFALLADFGVAIRMENDTFQTPFPNHGVTIAGAPSHLPPEVMLAEPGPDSIIDYSKSDVFGMGMVLYRMLSGDIKAKPFDCDNHAEFSAERYIELPDCYDSDIRNLIRSMLAPDASQRCSVQQARDIINSIDAAEALFHL